MRFEVTFESVPGHIAICRIKDGSGEDEQTLSIAYSKYGLTTSPTTPRTYANEAVRIAVETLERKAKAARELAEALGYKL